MALGAVPAEAAKRKPAAKATAAVVACGGDSLTLAARIKGPGAVRGANLRVRWQAVPLFGTVKSAREVDLGRKRSVTASKAFAGLSADEWSGYVRYRWVKRRKTILSGTVRTDRAKVGRRRGRASCTLAVGRPVEDRTAPAVFITPSSDEWLRDSVAVSFAAFDDHSGVRAVRYRVNGGAVQTGRSFTLATEGANTITYWAEDVAGNASVPKQAVLRVDTAAPSAPVVSLPAAVTGDTTPEIRWSAASDSGSGVRSYSVAVRDAGGTIVFFRSVAATGAAEQSVTVDQALADGAYTAQVIATDGTTGGGRSTGSADRAFTVDHVVHEDRFGGCGDFPAPSPPWSCAGAALETVSPERCLSDRTYATPWHSMPVGTAGSFTLSFLYSMAGPDADDRGTVEYRADGGTVRSKQYVPGNAGAEAIAVGSASSTVEVRFLHFVDNHTGGCSGDSAARFAIDDLRVLRD